MTLSRRRSQIAAVIRTFVTPEDYESAIAEADALARAVGVRGHRGRFRALYDEVRGDLDRHRADRHWASFPALSELKHVTKVLNHWRRHPLGEGIVRHALTRSADFPHEVVLLAAATYLSDSGNDVRLVKTAPDVKTPDAELAVGGLRAKVNAKTSSKLLAPSALHQATLDRIAGNSVKHASKQIRGADAGVIALGGFRLSRAGLHSLADALRRELASYRPERAHIAGCLVFSVGAGQDDVQPFLPPDPKRARLGVHERFASVVNPNLFQGIVGCVALANPDYRGPVPVLGPGGRGVGLQLRYEGALPIR